MYRVKDSRLSMASSSAIAGTPITTDTRSIGGYLAPGTYATRTRSAPARSFLCTEIRLAEGDGANGILNACEEDPATLAAVGARGRGLIRRALLGGVSTKVLRAASGPVLVHATPQGAAASGSGGMVNSAARA